MVVIKWPKNTLKDSYDIGNELLAYLWIGDSLRQFFWIWYSIVLTWIIPGSPFALIKWGLCNLEKYCIWMCACMPIWVGTSTHIDLHICIFVLCSFQCNCILHFLVLYRVVRIQLIKISNNPIYSLKTIFKLHLIYLCICVWLSVVQAKDNFWESLFSPQHVGPRDQTQVIRSAASAFTRWAISLVLTVSLTQKALQTGHCNIQPNPSTWRAEGCGYSGVGG